MARIGSSRKVEDLIPDWQDPVQKLLSDLWRQGHQLRLFYTLRDPWAQAKLWRQSRSGNEIERTAQKLEREGAEFLAEVLREVGPQNGRWATNALPGQSWHQWGEAIDCFVLEGNRAVWRRDHSGYRAYAELARERGFHAGFFWRRPDAVHVQLRADRVRDHYTWAQIGSEMRDRFLGVLQVPCPTCEGSGKVDQPSG